MSRYIISIIYTILRFIRIFLLCQALLFFGVDLGKSKLCTTLVFKLELIEVLSLSYNL